MKYNFEWDPVKAKSNLKKHGVSFEVAAKIFLDPLQINIPDEKHSETKERWITLGNTRSNKLRLVVHTYLTHYDDQITVDHFSQTRITTRAKTIRRLKI